MSAIDGPDSAARPADSGAGPEAEADAAEASVGIGGSLAGAGGAPPLGQRPSEPRPGKQSLADPQGKAAAKGSDSDGGKPDGGVCPDCGLPYGDHPDYAAGHHRPAEGHGHHGHDGGRGPQEYEGSDAHAAARGHGEHLPGEELDPRDLGGDPAEG